MRRLWLYLGGTVQFRSQLWWQDFVPNSVAYFVICADQGIDSVPEVGPVSVCFALPVFVDDDFRHGCVRSCGKNAVAAWLWFQLTRTYYVGYPLKKTMNDALKFL